MATSHPVRILESLVTLDREMSKVLGHADVVAETHDPAALTGMRDVMQGAVAAMIELRRRVLGSLVVLADHPLDHIPDLPSLRKVSTCTPFRSRNPGAKP